LGIFSYEDIDPFAYFLYVEGFLDWGEEFLVYALSDVATSDGLVEDGRGCVVELAHGVLYEGITDLYGMCLVFEYIVERVDLFA
jgi:hypothetical protein